MKMWWSMLEIWKFWFITTWCNQCFQAPTTKKYCKYIYFLNWKIPGWYNNIQESYNIIHGNKKFNNKSRFTWDYLNLSQDWSQRLLMFFKFNYNCISWYITRKLKIDIFTKDSNSKLSSILIIIMVGWINLTVLDNW